MGNVFLENGKSLSIYRDSLCCGCVVERQVRDLGARRAAGRARVVHVRPQAGHGLRARDRHPRLQVTCITHFYGRKLDSSNIVKIRLASDICYKFENGILTCVRTSSIKLGYISHEGRC